MYPGGFHPAKQDMAPDWKGKAKHFTRTERLPKYYFIDFGLSVRFRPEDPTPRAQVVRGGDRDYPPELEDMNVEYDPFPTDVFHLGHLIIHEFTEVRFSKIRNLSFVTSDLGQSAPWDQEDIRTRVHGKASCRHDQPRSLKTTYNGRGRGKVCRHSAGSTIMETKAEGCSF